MEAQVAEILLRLKLLGIITIAGLALTHIMIWLTRK